MSPVVLMYESYLSSVLICKWRQKTRSFIHTTPFYMTWLILVKFGQWAEMPSVHIQRVKALVQPRPGQCLTAGGRTGQFPDESSPTAPARLIPAHGNSWK